MKHLAGVGLASTGLALDVRGKEQRLFRPARKVQAICVFSKHLQFLEFSEMAQTAAEIGFQGVDLTVRPGGHVEPEKVEEDLPKAIEEVRRAGLEVPMITTAIRDSDDPLTTRVLTTASGLGIRHYRMGYYKYDPSLGIIGSLEALKPKLSDLADLNRSLNIIGGYQNHAGPYVGSPVWDLYLLLKDLVPNWIGCQYDIRHATVEGGRSWGYGLELVQDYIHTLVIKDFKWGNQMGEWREINLPLGQGMVDFASYFSKIKELGIGGPISIHFEYPLNYSIGVAVNAKSQKEKVVKAMKSDLEILKQHLAQAQLIGD